MFPPKLKRGDEIRVVSPSRSMTLISKENRQIAQKRFNELGLKVSISRNVEEVDEFNSSTIKSRVSDLHDAFADKNIKAIFTTIGGSNSNQLLKYLDYDLIRKNPKILCGYSDITALNNAILKKVGLVTYSGPHYSTLGMVKGLDYTLEYIKKCLIEESEFVIKPSDSWSDDPWYKSQNKREFIGNGGYLLINAGEAEGIIIGGNLCTFNLLQGTEFMPSLKDKILFLEDDEMAKYYSAVEFDRNLQSVLHLPNSDKIRGLVIGRFQKSSHMTFEIITKIIKSKVELKNIPVIANVDFGHTTPQITFPIGGSARLKVKNTKIKLEILKH